MVPLIISHDGAIHSDTARMWNEFPRDINVDRVSVAQNVLGNNVVIIGKYSDKRQLGVCTGRRERLEEIVDETDNPAERIATTEERGLK